MAVSALYSMLCRKCYGHPLLSSLGRNFFHSGKWFCYCKTKQVEELHQMKQAIIFATTKSWCQFRTPPQLVNDATHLYLGSKRWSVDWHRSGTRSRLRRYSCWRSTSGDGYQPSFEVGRERMDYRALSRRWIFNGLSEAIVGWIIQDIRKWGNF